MMTFTMTINGIALSLLVLLMVVSTTISSVVALDQYQQDSNIRDGKDFISQLQNEATDLISNSNNKKIQKSYHQYHHHRFAFSGKMKTVPELQVGCADGNIVEQTQSPPQISIKKAGGSSSNGVGIRSRNKRKIRSYNSWTEKVQLQAYPSISYWKPPTYQLSRPYFIPIYGAPGRIPIYYPPQPLLINPGSPIDNPPKVPFQGPTYLPPVVDTTTMSTMNRFGDDDDDARPIWDSNNNNNNAINNGNNVVPTRRPRPQSGTTAPPPLIHNPNATVSNGRPSSAPSSGFVPPAATPPEVPPPRITGPSNCVWAIISCCSTAGDIRYDCFEQRGCPGSFWDNNPCNNDFARAAIQAALNYYNTQ